MTGSPVELGGSGDNVLLLSGAPIYVKVAEGDLASLEAQLLGLSISSGDVNSDGFVNIRDVTTIIGNLGMLGPTYQDGDLAGDNDVDVGDLDIVKANWGFGFGGSEPPPEGIPEPATLGLLLVSGLIVLRRKQR